MPPPDFVAEATLAQALQGLDVDASDAAARAERAVPFHGALVQAVRDAARRAALLVQNLHRGHLDLLSIGVLSSLPADAAEDLAGAILSWCGWVLKLVERAGTRRPHGLLWRQAPERDDGKPPMLGVGKLLVSCLQQCRACNVPEASWPQDWPEFCGAACALNWMRQHSKMIERAARIDEELIEVLDQGHEEGVKAATDDAQEEARKMKDTWLNGEDNTLLDLLRSHTGDRSLDLETATWRLEYDILPKLTGR